MPSADWRQWLLWTIAAVLVPLLCAVLANGSSGFALFGVLLVCFAAGTAAGEFLLGRVWPASVSGGAPVPPPRAPEAEPDRQRALPASEPRRAAPSGRSDDAAIFASSSDAGKLLEITLLAARGPEVSDPAIGAFPGAVVLAPDDRPLHPGPVGGDGSSALLPDDVPTQEVPRIGSATGAESGARADAGRVEERERGSAADVAAPQVSSPAVPAIPAPTGGSGQDGAASLSGGVRAKADGRSPDKNYRVKGNSRSKLYHTMQSPYYERTKATVWFRSAAEAEEAGFAPWNWRAHNDN